MSIYSTIDFLHQQGEKDGRRYGFQEGACRQTCKLLLRHAKHTLGPAPPEQREALEKLADLLDLDQLEQLRERLPGVTTWSELLAGTVPPEQPLLAEPEYVQPYEFDPTRMPPSIDEYAKVAMVGGQPAVIHIRMQRLYQKDLGAILHQESELLRAKYNCQVITVVLLLWEGADGPGLTGQYQPPGGEPFRYQLTRLWEKDVDEMFNSPGTVALTPLARFAPERLPEVVRRMSDMIWAQKDPETVGNLWSVAYSSMGLRYPAEQVNELLADALPLIHSRPESKGVRSGGYHVGRNQGQADGAVAATRRWVLFFGGQKLGEPPAQVRQVLESLDNLERLEQIAGRLRKAASWQEALVLG